MRGTEFRSAVDGWLWAVFGISTTVSIAALVPVFALRVPWGWAFALVTLGLGVGLPLWLFRSTAYVVDDTTLRIRSGPFRWSVPLAEIREVRPSRSPLSSPALSLDRLEIRYGRGSAILVSPADRAGFLAAIGHPGAG